ncbi:MAG TPA: VirB4 family type IV secretion/conjugal transfer ATPase [Oligoflexus sp.]|uniref:VirB4 family type IV secretion/conjugal transfer ATPase n=1 Tax=Oligoflexus sp. TaxID=1971216 RepID=UPI002D7E7D9E|nr:VirB4 family type IV secretion/conjugal transfer ATPase [Oligoflexus sp.]HET9239206.1 VirB4 family type IV secretion/conjugal transfer ATPase [Oligoflexus sp.]
MFAQPKYRRQVSNERAVAPFVPYSSHISANTLITKDGDLVRIWKLNGISFETSDAEDMLLRKDQLNTLFRSIGSNHVALWTHNVRRQTSDRLLSTFDNNFCRDFDQKYFSSFAGYRMMANELYLTVVYRPEPIRLARAIAKIGRRTHAEILNEQRNSMRKLDEIGHQIESSMRRYGVEELSTYTDENGVLCSQALTFLNFLLSGEWQKVRVPTIPLNEYLGTSWIFVGTETIEIRSATKTRFAQCLDFKDYTAHTEPGILNGLMYEDYEYVLTQSFSFMAKRQGKEFLERQMKQLMNTEDGSTTQIEQIRTAIDQLIQGEFTMGEYHYSLLIFGESVEKVRRNTTSAMAIIQDRGFLAALVATATDAAFYAQLPCNWRYRPRIAGLTSKNFACLASFHNFTAGKRDGNPWGDAVTLFKTPSGQPLYFNFHYSKGDEDNFDKKLLGNTRVIGQSGAGKTALMTTLMVQSQKYKTSAPLGFTTIYFDKDEGAKICIKAMGGKYLSVKNGKPTGFQPMQMDPTEENILFLEKLVRTLVSGRHKDLTTNDEQRISHAVRTVMRMPRELRRLSTVLQNITEGTNREERENSVAKRLSQWCYDDGRGRQGPFAWVLDCPSDEIDFTTHSTYGFDGTDFLDNADVCTPISMYLLHRMESVIDGRRFIYWMDEAWKWIDDEAFADFAGDKQVTIRKQNGLGVFATQMPSQLLESKIASALVQQVATEIYLPNPKADFKEYTEDFKCSSAEYEIIKSLSEESRMFLIKQGHTSMIGRLDLTGFDDELAVLSGSSDNNELLDEIISEVGDNPDNWLPVFHERRRARSTSSRLQRGR